MSEDGIESSLFISFAEEDLRFVQNLVSRLRTLRFQPWYYTGYMVAGTRIHQILMEAIGRASAIIILVSKYSGQSDYVIRELHYAIQQRKRIIPLHLDNDVNQLTFILGDIAYINAQNGRDYIPELQQALDPLHHGRDYIPELQQALDRLHPLLSGPPDFWKRWLTFVTKAGVVAFVVLSLVWMGWNRPLRGAPSLIAMWFDNPSSYRLPAVPLPTTSLTYYGDRDNNPTAKEVDKLLSKRFEIDTGIKIDIYYPKQETRFETLYDVLKNKSDAYDVIMIDITWVGAIADHLIDLRPYFKEEEIHMYSDKVIENNTVRDNLIAIPLFEDKGLLFYRKDLIDYYNKGKIPATWKKLEEAAATIQKGERDQPGKHEFVGFAWQGADYEGLTVNALEWIGSQDGLDQTTGQITDKQAVVDSLDRARAWVEGRDGISWAVTSHEEEESLQRFIEGNAAFLRMWPNAYARLKKANKVSFDVAPLPSANGQKSVGMIGGWQLGVPKYSRKKQEAVEFIRYLTSQQVQAWRALEGGYVPTIETLFGDSRVKEAIPFLENIYKSVEPIIRPSKHLGQDYSDASECFHEQVYQALRAKSKKDIELQVSAMQQKENCEKFFKKASSRGS